MRCPSGLSSLSFLSTLLSTRSSTHLRRPSSAVSWPKFSPEQRRPVSITVVDDLRLHLSSIKIKAAHNPWSHLNTDAWAGITIITDVIRRLGTRETPPPVIHPSPCWTCPVRFRTHPVWLKWPTSSHPRPAEGIPFKYSTKCFSIIIEYWFLSNTCTTNFFAFLIVASVTLPVRRITKRDHYRVSTNQGLAIHLRSSHTATS